MLFFKEVLVVGFHVQVWHTTACARSRYYSSRSLKGHWLFSFQLRKYSDVPATCMPGKAWDIGGRASTCHVLHQRALTAHTSDLSADITDTCTMRMLQSVLKVSSIGVPKVLMPETCGKWYVDWKHKHFILKLMSLIVPAISHTLRCLSVSLLFHWKQAEQEILLMHVLTQFSLPW